MRRHAIANVSSLDARLVTAEPRIGDFKERGNSGGTPFATSGPDLRWRRAASQRSGTRCARCVCRRSCRRAPPPDSPPSGTCAKSVQRDEPADIAAGVGESADGISRWRAVHHYAKSRAVAQWFVLRSCWSEIASSLSMESRRRQALYRRGVAVGGHDLCQNRCFNGCHGLLVSAWHPNSSPYWCSHCHWHCRAPSISCWRQPCLEMRQP